MIEINNVTYKYTKDKQLGPLNISMSQGKVHCMIGENGAGKSTLISLLLKAIKPRAGQITVPSTINYMPDDLNFPPYLKVCEIITLLSGIKQRQANQILTEVGLQDSKDKYVKSLSKGMRQRLNLAQSIIGDAPLIIMDEPTNGLDPLWIFQLQEMILKQKSLGKTIFVTTHQLDFAQAIADEIYCLRDGVIVHQSHNDFEDVDELIALYKGIGPI
ncbi:ABC transporter ATP-binding protein [Macrococcus animalis]|uniref:ABC transporter ATP-binding protein n=1 Tax=Macrococcus animalis TaxID=3395467 RepID=UPI0039BE24F2